MSHHTDGEDITRASGNAALGSATRGLTEGQLLSQRYRVGPLLASGGMGLVYAGTHVLLGMPIVIKVLRPELGESAELRARFEAESRATASLRSDHVVRILDAGRLETGLPFAILERLVGTDLRAVSRQCGPLASAVAADYALQACAGLAEAHAIGLVHRDIKPANLFLAAGGSGACRVKVLDFGISKWLRRDAPDAPPASLECAGSPAYQSPEQLTDACSVDERTDIWSLGVVLFEMLTGLSPFARASFAETCARVLFAAVPSARSVHRDLAPGLCDIVARCLQRRRSARFSSILELQTALEPFSSSRAEPSPSASALGWSDGAAYGPWTRQHGPRLLAAAS